MVPDCINQFRSVQSDALIGIPESGSRQRPKKLAIGRVRYGVMLREDGFGMDDGTTLPIGETDYFSADR